MNSHIFFPLSSSGYFIHLTLFFTFMVRSRTKRRPRQSSRRTRVPPSVKTALHGRKISPSADPRSTLKSPWNSLTLSFKVVQETANVPINFIPSAIANLIKEQLALPTTLGLEFRIFHVNVWSLDSTSGGVGFRAWDTYSSTSGGLGNPLTVLIDFPGKNRWAKVGYTYPSTQQNNVFPSAAASPNLFDVEAEIVGSSLLIRVSLLWRPSSDLSPTTSFVNSRAISHKLLLTPSVHSEQPSDNSILSL